MFRKNYFTFLLSIALFLAGSVAAFAQAAPVRGKVELRKADGTVVPVEGATIDAYRTDIVSKLPSAKTNKKGEFVFAGVPYGAKFAIAVSAPNIKSDVYPNIKAGDEAVNVTVVEGDGKPLTEAEARQILASAPVSNQPGELTAEQQKAQQKAQEEYQKQVAANEVEKTKVNNINTVTKNAFAEGKKAFDAKDYDLAITKFDEGFNADPEFEGTAPIFLNNKSAALIERARSKYNAAITGDQSGRAAAIQSVKKDLQDSVAASTKALQILKTASGTDANVKKAYDAEKMRAYQNSVDAYSKMFSTNADNTKGKEALAALDEYSAAQSDAAMKAKWQLILADGFRASGDSEDAIVVYRKIIETTPDNPDALAGLGLSLFSVGAETVPENAAQMQEGLNYMQRFTEVAPDNHPLKASVKDAVDYLKGKSFTPQKTPKNTSTKKKS